MCKNTVLSIVVCNREGGRGAPGEGTLGPTAPPTPVWEGTPLTRTNTKPPQTTSWPRRISLLSFLPSSPAAKGRDSRIRQPHGNSQLFAT